MHVVCFLFRLLVTVGSFYISLSCLLTHHAHVDIAFSGKHQDVHVNNFTLAPPDGGAELIKNGDLILVDGRRYGFVGKNGTGKSTLLKAIAEYKLEDFPRHVRVLIVEQEARGTSKSVLQQVLESDDLREALLAQEKTLVTLQDSEDADVAEDAAFRLDAVYEKLKEINSFNADARAINILYGLGFTKEMTTMPTRDLSGGWLMRYALRWVGSLD
jgi:ATPase subunit of ABC transporter with duplicated ATPase domains